MGADLVSILERQELVRTELHQLLSYAGYWFAPDGSPLQGQGDPDKLDIHRARRCTGQLAALLESLIRYRCGGNPLSHPRLQELLAKAGFLLKDGGFVDTYIDLIDVGHRLSALSRAEKEELRDLASSLKKREKPPFFTLPTTDVRGVLTCWCCGETLPLKAYFCSNCGSRVV